MSEITSQKISKMSYVKLMAFLEEVNRPPGGKDSIRVAVQNCFITKDSKVLDIGCNTGYCSFEIVHLSRCSVTGIDISPVMIRTAKKFQKEDPLGNLIKFRVADAMHLPFTKKMFDVGRQMALLNQSTSGYGWIDATTFQGYSETWNEFLLSYVNTCGSRLSETKIVDQESVAKAVAIARGTDLTLNSPCLLHRDLKLTNFLVDEKGKMWIIDWENAILGDPLYDLAIVGAREGHNFVWQNLVKGRLLEVDSPRYQLYETLALFGFLDFGRRYDQQYEWLRKRLVKLLSVL